MKSYLFDFDGTLVDSMPNFADTMLRILDESGVKYPSDIIKTITPLGYRGTAKYFLDMGIGIPEGELIKKMHDYAVLAYLTAIPAKETVPETLRELKRRGFSLNVLTASPHLTLDPCLKRLGLFELFDNVWSCEDFNTNKANPDIYKMAAERMGVSVSEVIFLDDNLDADKTAKKAGCTVIGVYDDSSADYVDEMKKITDGYIYRFSELL